MASAGAAGAHPQNMQRDLISAFGMPAEAPAFTWYPVPTKHGLVAHPFLLPHLWLAAIYVANPTAWATSIRGLPGEALAFWRSMKDTAVVRMHPAIKSSDWANTIPLGLHGDGGAFSHQDSLFVFTWNSLLGTGTTLAKRFILTVIKKSVMVPDTLAVMFKIVAWSFNVLLTALMPELDWDAKPMPLDPHGPRYIAGGYKAALIQIRGDWEFYSSVLELPNWGAGDEMCWLCHASKGGRLTYTRSDPGAGWRGTRRTHESYCLELAHRGVALPPLLARVVGLRLESVMIDILHTVDQGVASHIVANIFWEAVIKKSWGHRKQEDNVNALMEELQAHYKSAATPKGYSRIQGNLTVDRLRTAAGFPKLKAKAAATRHCATFALIIARRCLDHKRVALIEMLCRFYEIVALDGMFLSKEAKEELPNLGRHMMMLYGQLSAESLAAGRRLYKISPKHHLFVHLCEWQAVEMGNPRFYWTYADEDLVGSMIDMARSCHPRTLPATAMYKWLIYSFRFEPNVEP